MKKKATVTLILSFLLIGVSFYAYALFTSVAGGYKLGGYGEGVYFSNLVSCNIVTNNSNKSYFIPTNTIKERLAFDAHTPSDIQISTAAMPDCGETAQYTCDVGTDTFHVPERECGDNGGDMCYGWECKTDCGSTECQYVDIGGCFVAGTMVTMSDGSQKPIESIVTGEVLLGAGDHANAVQKLFKIDYKRKLYSFNGGKYFVSDTHPFMTTEGWKSFYPKGTLEESPDLQVSLLEVGDVLVTEHGLVKLITVDYIYDRQYVYNFKTDGSHTYYADGYLVHNPNDKIAQ